jgi:hypothetical protein
MGKLPQIVIGAGLAGLACALTLRKSKREVLILEAQSQVGGRIQSRRTPEGFLVDEGFQVLLTSYPELRRFVDLDQLELKPFHSGALIYNGKKNQEAFDLLANPLWHPCAIFDDLTNENLNLMDIFLTLNLLRRSRSHANDSPMGKTTTLQFLHEFGFSDSFISYFWIPFLSGVYLDQNLESGSDFFMFLIRCFGFGSISLPREGMSALPKQMAQNLEPGSFRFNCSVRSWTKNSVTLEGGEVIGAENVICAHDPSQNLEEIPYRELTTHYFTSSQFTKLNWRRWLALVPPKHGFSINHMAMLSEVNSNYSANGEPLLSVSVLSGNSDVGRVKKELQQITGLQLGFKEVCTTVVRKALPVSIAKEGNGFAVKDGVFYCGDRWASPSINGALRSGRMVAEKILSRDHFLVT